MAGKLTYKVLHPGNNKHNTALAIAIFHESTIAACKRYCHEKKDVAAFVTLMNGWWTIVNVKTRYSPNPFAHTIVKRDGKVKFLCSFSHWLEEWSYISKSIFSFTKQTSEALVKTLRAKSLLICQHQADGYDLIISASFQSDPIERRFSQCRQMSSGCFFVNLTEIQSSEKILLIQSLIKKTSTFGRKIF